MNCVIRAWEKHEAELRAFINKNIPDARVSEDLLQDTFLKAIQHGAQFCSLENPRAWLFTVTRNQLVDFQRKQKKTEPLAEDIEEENETISAIESLSSCLPHALEKLDKKDRDILQKCDLDGLNQLDYAKQNNIGISTAKSRIQRARKKLKQQLNQLCHVKYDTSGNVCCYIDCETNNK